MSSDLTGKRFGRLIALKMNQESDWKKSVPEKWLCRCDCGNETVVQRPALLSGHSTSCGCKTRESTSISNRTHGGSKTRLYRIWKQMRIRCTTVTNPTYKFYGARGISICPQWGDFAVFHTWAMSHGYNDTMSIDRINVNGNYCPENCRWIPRNEQARNTRESKEYTHDGVTLTHNLWAKRLGINPSTLTGRIRRNGIEIALAMPKGGIICTTT
jgi:hypothetical protein